MYFAIEGIKGSGKSTVFEQALLALGSRGLNPIPLRPTAPRKGCLLDKIHLHYGKHLPDWLVERIYAMRSNHAARQLPNSDELILGERSLMTSYVTRWNAEDPIAGLERVDALERVIPIPHHVIYLSVPIPTALQRIGSRTRRRYGLCDQTEPVLTHADRTYKLLARFGSRLGLGNVRWHFVDATKCLNEVVQDVIQIVAFHEAQGVPAVNEVHRFHSSSSSLPNIKHQLD